ncbi:MAG: transporter substrate-binding domain-containing protein [Boseongicola sp.]|nr:transporter substrate-binding domain-containing protein [Boseongicola sp.]
MKRREFVAFAGASTAATLIAGPVFAQGELELITPGVLTSATEGGYPPFSMRKPNGELDGLEMRIMGEICKRLGLKYEPVIVKWESMLVGLQANQYDIVGNAMGITEERQKAVTFCDGWVETGAQVVVREGSDYSSADQLRGKKIGAIAASTFIPIVESLGGELKAYKGDIDGMQDLVNGNIDAVILEAIAANFAITKSKLPLRALPGLIDPAQLGWAVKKGKPNLVTAINETRAEMVAEGKVAELFDDIIGFDPSPKEPIRSIL